MSIEEHSELDQVPAELLSPPDFKVPPPAATRAQTLPLHEISWENFERLCVRLARLDGDIDQCRLYGTQGQKQHGIDLYARPASSEKYRVYQCKRYQELTATDIKRAVDEFRQGKWFARSSHFFICTSASLVTTQNADEWESQHTKLKAEGVDFEIFDREEISLRLKTEPVIVDDFFGRAWVAEFCGLNSLPDQQRMDGGAVAEFREKMRRFYEALVERLDPGIPIPPAAGREAIPLQDRFVLPDVEVPTSVPETMKGRVGTKETETLASPPQEPEQPQPSAQYGQGERKYTHRLPAHAWISQGKNCVIVGGPGSGKRTLLRYLALEILGESPSDERVAPFVTLLPVIIPFAFWTKQISQERECSVSECIRRWLSLWGQDSLWPIAEAAVKDCRLLVLLDGLDEWSTEEAGRVAANMLQVFLQTHGVKAIATTRPFEGVGLHGPDWLVAEIAQLTTEQQSDLCNKWFVLNGKATNPRASVERAVIDRQVDSFMAEVSGSHDLQELAAVPLLLLSLIFVHLRRAALPRDRFAAYDQLVTYLIQEHPARRIAAALTANDSGFSPLREHEVRLIFSYVGFAVPPGAVVEIAILLRLVEEFLNNSEGLGLGLDAMQARALASQFARVAEGGCGLIIKQGFDDRAFLHRSIQDFLASAYISHLPLPKQQQIVGEHVLDPRWREIILGLLWHTTRPDDVIALIEPISIASERATDEMYRTELLAEIAFGPFNCPAPRTKDLASDAFRRIQRQEWAPHRARLLSHALQGSDSAKTRSAIRSKLRRWAYDRCGWRSSWVEALRGWPATAETVDLLFDLLNDYRFDVQKAAAQILVGTKSDHIAKQLRMEFRRTTDPWRQAAILHGLNSASETADLGTETEFAHRSRFAPLHIEAIRARVIRSVHDDRDLQHLLEIGSRRLSTHELSEDICDLLVRGWPNAQQLKEACFDGLRRPGPEGGLEPSVAIWVLLSAFPHDPDVAKYAAGEITAARYPFIGLYARHNAFALLAANFRDDPELVAAIDRWGPSQQYSEPEVSHAALVGRTELMKQVLIRNLQSHISFWAADSLVKGWGPEDAEVSGELMKLAFGPASLAAGIAEYIPKILKEPDQARQRLREILVDPTVLHNRHRVLMALSRLNLPQSEKEDIASFCIRVRSEVPYIYSGSFDATLIMGFKELESVRRFAVQALADREPPVGAVASAYGMDPEIRGAITDLISPLPYVLRSQIMRHLAKGDEDQFALKLLAEYDTEHDAELKTEASVAYHKLLLATRSDLAAATSYLSDTVTVGGVDMDARRQAALAGLAVLGRLDIMAEKLKTMAKSHALHVELSHLGQLNVALARALADSWARYGKVFWDQIEIVLETSHDPASSWDGLALVAVDTPVIRARVLDRLDQDRNLSLMPGALSLLAHVRPHSELLRRRCISAIRDTRQLPYGHDPVPRAISILENQFDDRQAVAAEIIEGRPPFAAIVIALAALDPDHPAVIDMYKAINIDGGVTVSEYFAVVYACVDVENIVGKLQGDLKRGDLVNRYNHDELSNAVIRRIKRDLRAQTAFVDALDGTCAPELSMNLLRLLDAAGFIASEFRDRCLAEANSQIQAGLVECGFDVVSGEVRAIPLSLLDVADRAE